jgi:hypothetical protein
MKLSRRNFVHAGFTVAAGFVVPKQVDARLLHGSAVAVAPTRVLLACYGQSNMGAFFSSESGSPPTPNANTYYYNGSSTVNPIAAGTLGEGIIACMNQISNVAGFPVICLKVAVAGTAITGLMPGTNAFTSFIAQINAVIQPTDYVVVLWDQGEGDSNTAPPEQPQTYIDNLKLIRDGIASSLGLPNIALLCAGLGTFWAVITDGQPSGGSSQYTWQRIRNAQLFSSIQIPHVYFSHTNIDIVRFDATDYHYIAPTIQGIGQRFAQNVTTLMGVTSGFAHWEIADAATVDATHTNVNLTQTLGTDFTPTSSADGWEVSGDNGANWVTATGARNSSTQLELTHSSLSTTSARLVRYQWGYNQAGSCAGPTPGYLRDNSAYTVPLTPTTWDIRPNGASSTVPCATWRNIDTLTGTFSAWTSRKLLCWPSTDNYQKFIIIAIYSGFLIDTSGNPLTIVLHPDVGSPVTATFVAEHPSTNAGGGLALYQALFGTDADPAQYLTVTASQPSNPFTNYTFHIYDVNAAYLNSTTNTGTNNATTTLTANTTPPLTSNCTVNVSAGGLMIAMNAIDVSQTTSGAFATYSSNFNNRWEDGSTITLDAANSSANASSPFSVSFGTTNPSNPINMYTLMASWR